MVASSGMCLEHDVVLIQIHFPGQFGEGPHSSSSCWRSAPLNAGAAEIHAAGSGAKGRRHGAIFEC
jgi:hypothetical protein